MICVNCGKPAAELVVVINPQMSADIHRRAGQGYVPTEPMRYCEICEPCYTAAESHYATENGTTARPFKAMLVDMRTLAPREG